MNELEFNGDVKNIEDDADAIGEAAAAVWNEIGKSTGSGNLVKALAKVVSEQSGRSGSNTVLPENEAGGSLLDVLPPGNSITGDPNAKGDGSSRPGGRPADMVPPGNSITGDPNAKGEGSSRPGGRPVEAVPPGNSITGNPHAKGEGGLPGGGPGEAPAGGPGKAPRGDGNGAGGPAGGDVGGIGKTLADLLAKQKNGTDGNASREIAKQLEKGAESIGQQLRDALLSRDIEKAQKAFEQILEKTPPPAGCEKMAKDLGTALLTGDLKKAQELLKNIGTLEDGRNLQKTCAYLRETLGLNIKVTGHPYSPELTISDAKPLRPGPQPDIALPPPTELVIDRDGSSASGYDRSTGGAPELKDVVSMFRNKLLAKLTATDAK